VESELIFFICYTRSRR